LVEWSEVGLRVRRFWERAHVLGVLRDNLVTRSYYSALLRIQQIEIPNEVNHSMTIDAPAIPIADSDSRHSGPDAGRRARPPHSQLLSVFTFFYGQQYTHLWRPTHAPPQHLILRALNRFLISLTPQTWAHRRSNLRCIFDSSVFNFQHTLVSLRAFRGRVFIREASPP
jgi:hypothetical protein